MRVKETPPTPHLAGGRLPARGHYRTMKLVLADVLATVGFSPSEGSEAILRGNWASDISKVLLTKTLPTEITI